MRFEKDASPMYLSEMYEFKKATPKWLNTQVGTYNGWIQKGNQNN